MPWATAARIRLIRPLRAWSKLRFASLRDVQLFLKQLVIRPFRTDFDLRGSPPVYKTAALPIELGRRPLKGSGTLLRGGWQVDSLHWVGRRARRVDQPGRRRGPQHEDLVSPLGGHGVAVHESLGT